MFEQNLMNSLYNENSEKTYIDKLLGRRETDRTKYLISKQKLTREEISELLYMLHGTESKLWNFGAWERYIILKFFVWIREFVKISEVLFDAQEYLKSKDCDKIKGEVPTPENGKWILSNTSIKMMENNIKLIEHNTKFLVELYLNIVRTSLSIGGTGFLELLKNKFELSYPEVPLQSGQVSESKVNRWFGKNNNRGNN